MTVANQVLIYKFCPRCGANTLSTSGRRISCLSCNLELYIGLSACTMVVLFNSKKQILLTRRKFNPYANTWDLPGGFIEMNESFEDGARREISEELNITIGELLYVNSVADEYLFQEVNYKTISVNYSSQINENDFAVSDDITEARFFSYKEIPWNEIKFNSVKATIHAFIKQYAY